MFGRLLITLLRGYKRFVSPWLGNRCRFYPSCSDYARGAIERHGAIRGSLMTTTRLLRCQPLCDGGMDPVPERFSKRFWARNRSADPPPQSRDG